MDFLQSELHGYSNAVIIDWNLITADTITADNGYADPFMASRALGMVHIAMHDAVNTITPYYHTYNSIQRYSGEEYGDPVAAAAAAAHGVLVSLFPGQSVELDSQLAASLAGRNDVTARERGVAVGQRAASAIVAARQGDGSEIFGEHIAGTDPGDYQPTAPFFFAFRPAWGNVTPFALSSGDQFRVNPPPALDSAQYAAEFNEVKTLGDINSTVRTAEQSTYAEFWYEFSDIGWNRVGRTVTTTYGLNLWRAGRLFALLNMALADSYIAGVESKYHYDFWRPITAIPAADTDGNPNTVADASWEPFLPTPPVPDHPSTHSALGNAAAEVLKYVFWSDYVPFTMTSSTANPPDSTRTYYFLSDAANENADSRVVAGIHFRSACDEGQELGRKVGKHTVWNYLGWRGGF